MSQLVFLVVTDPSRTHEVIDAWLGMGASGIMIMELRGLAHLTQLFGARDDVPFISSFENMVQQREEPYQALMDIVPDDYDIPRLIEVTEKITGPLSDPETGILFTMPVSGIWGRYRGKTSDA